MLHHAGELKHFAIRAQDEDIGSVVDLFFDDRQWTVRYLVIDTGGWLIGRRVLVTPIAIRQVRWNDRAIDIALTRQQVENSPDIASDLPVSRQKEIEYFRYYGYPPYWSGGGLWGAGMYPGALMGPAAVAPAPITPPDAQTDEAVDAGDPHLRSVDEVRGYGIRATDDELGSVEDFLLDDQTWSLRYLVVDTGGWLSGRKVLVAPRWIRQISWEDRAVAVDLPRDVIAQAPEFDPSRPIDRDYETRLHAYYRQPAYWDEERARGA